MNQSELALPDPTKTYPEKWTASCVITGNLVAALRGQEEFHTDNHYEILREGRGEVQNQNIVCLEVALEETLAGAPTQVACHLQRVKKTGAWLMLQSSTVNGTELGAQEWIDDLFLRCGLDPPELQKSVTAVMPLSESNMPLTARRVE